MNKNMRYKNCKCGSKIWYDITVSRTIPDKCNMCQKIENMKQTKLNAYTNEQEKLSKFGDE